MENGEGDYRKLIDEALDQSMILIAVGISREFLEQMVQYEYTSFHEDILSGCKGSKCTVCSYISDMKPSDLPLPLRNLQPFENINDVVEFILNRLNLNSKDNKSVDDEPIEPPVKVENEKINPESKVQKSKAKERKIRDC